MHKLTHMHKGMHIREAHCKGVKLGCEGIEQVEIS